MLSIGREGHMVHKMRPIVADVTRSVVCVFIDEPAGQNLDQ